MASSSATATAPSTRRVLTASLVGTAVEFYDFYIYATAASLVFGPLFFPSASPSMQLLSSYATMAVAFFARPLGAIVFGHFGDRIGRKSTLVASLMLMGGSTVAIAFLPTYAQAGWLAPVLLCVLRFGQGFGLGGEWGGAALLAVENAPPGWRARYGMFPQLGAPVGFIAANSLFLLLGMLLTPEQFQAWGWRIPFLGSVLLVGVGLWVRLKLTETPAFSKALEEEKPSAVPLAELFKRHLAPTLAGTFAVVACFATFYLATAFALGYGVQTLGYSRETFLGIQLGAIGFMALGIVIAGYWSDATNPRRVLMSGCVMAVAVGALIAPMMGSGSLLACWAFLSLALLTMGFVYGPLGAFLPGLFPARVRYTGASMAFNVGGIIGGGLTPMVAQALSNQGGLVPVGIYLAVAALVSFLALLPLKQQQA
ncbi:MFS transporter [Phenylobacterium sp. Root700]|uniref:MFS transporter n=1 Tax=Phenylobacterium sp. Root700 TaxID=1736591 RepID=UPI0006F8DF43|nr:MFS transporter [Phenylobacterium sp. Root700]KRB46553.1 MFS transporter [Phenylobacterium sp. Root700]